MDVGDIRVDPVLDAAARLDPASFFQGPARWVDHRHLLGADGLLGVSIGGLLVRTGDRVALVDLGLSQLPLPPYQGGRLLESLAAIGVRREDVTDVLFTHLHIDHIGWASTDGGPTFPHATYRCHEEDWRFFVEARPGGVHSAVLGPVTGRLEPWGGSGSILPGFDALSAPGHTPGSTVVVLSSGTARAMLLGDVVHCPVQLLDDQWPMVLDVDPDLARRTRTAIAREVEGAGIPVVGAHFDGMRFGRVLRAEGRRQWVVQP